MAELVLTTNDWVSASARGHVRGLRVRRALEEAGLPCRVASTPFRARGAGHRARQPFLQVPCAVLHWSLAARNSVETFTQPWALLAFAGPPRDESGGVPAGDLTTGRLANLEPVHARGAETLSDADTPMADVLRPPARFGGLDGFPTAAACVTGTTARPAFAKARADRRAHFAAADAAPPG
jgi:glutathione S-transferase